MNRLNRSLLVVNYYNFLVGENRYSGPCLFIASDGTDCLVVPRGFKGLEPVFFTYRVECICGKVQTELVG